MDRFIPLKASLDMVLELVEKDPLKLFRYVRKLVENEVGKIHHVTFYDSFVDPSELDIVIEYIAYCKLGEVSIKLIYSKNPEKALEKYYKYESSKLIP